MKAPRLLPQPALAIAAILLAVLAQYVHMYRQADEIALLLFAVALFSWLAVLFLSTAVLDTRLAGTASPGGHARQTNRGLILSVLALAFLTFLFSSGNEFTPDNVLAWVLSVGVFLYAFWEPEKTVEEWRVWLCERGAIARAVWTTGLRVSPRVVMLVGIMLIGVFSYYYNLDGVPAEMDSDHAEKILDVNDVVNGGLAPIFFERNTGRESLQFYLTAAFVRLTGHRIDHMALKSITAAIAILVIPGTFLFARELFDENVAFLAAALVAISRWTITIARMGLRFPFTPVFVAPLMYFLFRALKYQRRNDFLMAGLFLGVGLYGYNAFRVVPVLVVVFLVLWLLVRRMGWAQIRRYVANSVLMFALMVVVLMPLLRYTTEHPDMVWYRVVTRITDAEKPLDGSLAAILASNLVRAALMFNWTGDEAWPNSIPGDPALDYVAGGLFLLGVVYAVYHCAARREPTYAFVLIGWGVLLLPTALSLAFPNENPSIVRAGGAIPFVFIIAALPIAWTARVIRRPLGDSTWSRVVAVGLVALLLAFCVRTNYQRYFRDFDESYRRYSWNSSEVAAVIRGFADSVGDVEHAWIVLYPHWVDTRNVAINMGHIGWEQTLPQADDALGHAQDGANRLYVLNLNDTANLFRLKEIFPNGQERIFHARTPGHDFSLFYVPGTIASPEPLGAK